MDETWEVVDETRVRIMVDGTECHVIECFDDGAALAVVENANLREAVRAEAGPRVAEAIFDRARVATERSRADTAGGTE